MSDHHNNGDNVNPIDTDKAIDSEEQFRYELWKNKKTLFNLRDIWHPC
ncbi:MAG TPA: hypothetical protein VFZ55_04645 [Nitrososphaera sp.]